MSTNLLTAIVLAPLLGFLVNGTLGNRLGKKFVTVVGCGLPIAAFALAVKCFLDLRAAGYAPLVDVAYTWLVAGQARFEVAFYFDRLAAVMALIVTGVGSRNDVGFAVAVRLVNPIHVGGRFVAYWTP